MRSPVWGSVGGVEDTTRATGRGGEGWWWWGGEERGGGWKRIGKREGEREREGRNPQCSETLLYLSGISGNKILGFVTS